jgi:D-serine dehydratase
MIRAHLHEPNMTEINADTWTWNRLSRGEPTFWLNTGRPIPHDTPPSIGLRDIEEARARWERFAPLLKALFPDQIPDGIIESPLIPVPKLAARFLPDEHRQSSSHIFVKADHALPVAGSVKARGGIYEVLCLAERVALAEKVIADYQDDYAKLASPAAREKFARYRLLVASTGNLGFAVGTMGRALGFETTVHMSSDAKTWKKDRLRKLGAIVVEHSADYTSAVSAARAEAEAADNAHFVDDEQSLELFLGYSVAGLRVADQLRKLNVEVTAQRPLCVYLPCGVGGAPGGVLFGLRAVFGDNVWGFFAEPTASACMLMRLMSHLPPEASVYDIGLDNRTEADGLAVGRASELVVAAVGEHVKGAFTVADDEMFRWVARAHREEGLRLEPSAAAGFPGALQHVWTLPQREQIEAATHIVWTTGGSMVPEEQYQAMLQRGLGLTRLD